MCLKKRKSDKEELHDQYKDPVYLHGPNLAPMPPRQDSVAPTEDQYEDEEESSSEEEERTSFADPRSVPYWSHLPRFTV